jgi:hypothetical protein
MTMINKIIEFPYFVFYAAGMILGPAFWYVISAIVLVFAFGIVLGVML